MNDYYATWVHQIKAPIAVMKVLLQQEDTPENRELSAELFRVGAVCGDGAHLCPAGRRSLRPDDPGIRPGYDHQEGHPKICGTVYQEKDPPDI